MEFLSFKHTYKDKITEIINKLDISVEEKRNYNNLENKLLSLIYYIKTYSGKDVYSTSRFNKIVSQAEELFMECGATGYLPPKERMEASDKKKNKKWVEYCKLKKVAPEATMLNHLNSELFQQIRKNKIMHYGFALLMDDKPIEKIIEVAEGGWGFKGIYKKLMDLNKKFNRNEMLNYILNNLPDNLKEIFQKDLGYYIINESQLEKNK